MATTRQRKRLRIGHAVSDLCRIYLHLVGGLVVLLTYPIRLSEFWFARKFAALRSQIPSKRPAEAWCAFADQRGLLLARVCRRRLLRVAALRRDSSSR